MILPPVRAPEFPINSIWLNTNKPLTLKGLKGRIILLDFWTYCCINCIHILSDLKYLEQKYHLSLTVIGVHSSKFAHEKEPENIRQAVLRYNIEHPVVIDSKLTIWDQYAVRAWPTMIIIDPQSYVTGSVSGEGQRETLDNLIALLLQKNSEKINYQPLNLVLEKQTQPLISPLAFPGKVLVDETSNRLFIADSGHHRLIVSNLRGEVLKIIGNGQAGWRDGHINQSQFCVPQGMTLDHDFLYVADTQNHLIRQINLQSDQVTTIAGTGSQSPIATPNYGDAFNISLNSPWDLVKIGHIIYIAMAGNHQIWQLDLFTNQIGTYAGTGAEFGLDGALNVATFAQPSGIATDGNNLYIADAEISSLRAITLSEPATVHTLSGSGDLFGFGDRDGQGFEVLFQHCLGVTYHQGYLWVADTYNHKIKRVNPHTGDCETFIGTGFLQEPSGLSALKSFLYIADTNNHRVVCLNLETKQIKEVKFPNLCPPGVCLP